MNVHNLDCIFKPKRIALVGVSSNPNSVSGKVLSNLVGSGFQGVVYPVNAGPGGHLFGRERGPGSCASLR